MISFEEARDLVIRSVEPLAQESIGLQDAAGRVCAADVKADTDLIPFARSAMDGFAVGSADMGAIPVRLRIARTVFAGNDATMHERGTATRIATGAPLPAGADTVVPIECVRTLDGQVEIESPPAPGEHVFPPGEDARCGDALVDCGEIMDAGTIGLLAANGTTRIDVFRMPRAGLVCTGDELVRIDESPRPGQVRNSNAPMLAAAAWQCGARIVLNSWVRDEPSELRRTLEQALEAADVLVTSGGASAGERDYVKATLTDIGVRFLFRSVAMRPGRPSAFGIHGRKLVAVLPGNPAAAFTSFVQLVRPAVYRLAGRRYLPGPTVRASLTQGVVAKDGLRLFIFARLAIKDGAFEVQPLGNQCSALVRTAADANCFITLPPKAHAYLPGQPVQVDVLKWDQVAGTTAFARPLS